MYMYINVEMHTCTCIVHVLVYIHCSCSVILSFFSLSLVVNAPPSPAKLVMKQKMENMRQEHTAALKHEGTRMKK